MTTPSIGISDFYRKYHSPTSGRTLYIGAPTDAEPLLSEFTGNDAGLIKLVEQFWYNRIPGTGQTDTNYIVLIPVPPVLFKGTTVFVLRDHLVDGGLGKPRQEGEESHLTNSVWGRKREISEHEFKKVVYENRTTIVEKDKVTGAMRYFVADPVEPDPIHFAKIVVYSKEALVADNGKRSTDCEWEIVSLIASEIMEQPMHMIAMARNFLGKDGGTRVNYTPEQFAESIWYWTQHCNVKKAE